MNSPETLVRCEGHLVSRAVNGKQIPAAAETLRPHHFADQRARLVWGRLLQMRADEIPINLEAVAEAVGELGGQWPHPTPDAPDPLGYIGEVCSHIPTDAETAYAVRTIQEEWSWREQAKAADEYSQAIQGGDDDRIARALDRMVQLRLRATERIQRGLAAGWKPLPTEWIAEPPPRRDYLLSLEDGSGVLPRGKAGVLAAAGGAGKSFALCQLALAVATGRDWLGFTTWGAGFESHDDPGGKVLLLAGEEEPDELRRRIYRAARVMRLNDDDYQRAAPNLYPIGLAGVDVALLRTVDRTPEETAFLADLRSRLDRDGPWSLVIIDPLSRFGGSDFEKDNAAATRAIVAVESLTTVKGAPAVLCAHHTSQASRNPEAKPKDDDGAAAGVRGVTAIVDGFRFVMQLQTRWQVKGGVLSDKGPRLESWQSLRVTKSNYGLKPQPVDVVRDSATKGALRVATEDERRRLERARDDETGAAKRKGNGKAKTETKIPDGAGL